MANNSTISIWRKAWQRSAINKLPEDLYNITISGAFATLACLIFCFDVTVILIVNALAYMFSTDYAAIACDYGYACLMIFLLGACPLAIMSIIFRVAGAHNNEYVKHDNLWTPRIICDFLRPAGSIIGVLVAANLFLGFLALVKLVFFEDNGVLEVLGFFLVIAVVFLIFQPFILLMGGHKKYWLWMTLGTVFFGWFNPIVKPLWGTFPWALVEIICDIVWVLSLVEICILRIKYPPEK